MRRKEDKADFEPLDQPRRDPGWALSPGEALCQSCRLPFVADFQESWRQVKAGGPWERRYVQTRFRCPDCIGEGGRKPESAMDVEEYRRKGLMHRLRDGFAMMGDDELGVP